MDCPFCGETGFDAIGLKCHLIIGGMWHTPCEVFITTPTVYPKDHTPKDHTDNIWLEAGKGNTVK